MVCCLVYSQIGQPRREDFLTLPHVCQIKKFRPTPLPKSQLASLLPFPHPFVLNAEQEGCEHHFSEIVDMFRDSDHKLHSILTLSPLHIEAARQKFVKMTKIILHVIEI